MSKSSEKVGSRSARYAGPVEDPVGVADDGAPGDAVDADVARDSGTAAAVIASAPAVAATRTTTSTRFNTASLPSVR
ncbi:hypothetical protein [Curtobacterium sp. Arg-1]|uniref:hypothetical protein n=1 Tax=Curtobacterium sp. Arg-1 TaxID=2935040 RepID=UPI0021D84945|nr:hypothetical protein [Curtobacterium sp. Arg-1]UXZ56727.1 hypothetical protein MXD64_11930 [Curtobacterium sp. Arg-1]